MQLLDEAKIHLKESVTLRGNTLIRFLAES